MILKLWLDDIRTPPDNTWIHVYSADTAFDLIEIVGLYQFEVMSLDHDLGDNVPTGYDFLNKIEHMVSENTQDVPTIMIHSANPVGRKNMEAAIKSIYKLGWKDV